MFRRRCDDLPSLAATTAATASATTTSLTTTTTTTSETVPLDAIVGTIARCCDFDRCFRPRHRHLRSRLGGLRTAMCCRALPAIRLLRIGDDHFVIDGHHRVALARERGMVALDAVVTCRCPAAAEPLAAGADPDRPSPSLRS